MSEFPECLLIVTAEVDAAIEGDWNRWYDTVHLPDALRCPGVRRELVPAARAGCAQPGYFALNSSTRILPASSADLPSFFSSAARARSALM